MMTPKKWIMLGVAKVVFLAMPVGVVFSLYGCQTVQGLGRDIETAGEAIQRSTR
jgi:predicted small secreted protein